MKLSQSYTVANTLFKKTSNTFNPSLYQLYTWTIISKGSDIAYIKICFIESVHKNILFILKHY